MTSSKDLIATVRRLARANPRRPKQADLKRAVSTAYYAMFHALAGQCADLLVGVGQVRGNPSWTQVYRALAHGFSKDACMQVRRLGFPSEIVDFADAFVRMQEERHRADYDPNARYRLADAETLISNSERAISALESAQRPDRLAFVILVLLRKR